MAKELAASFERMAASEEESTKKTPFQAALYERQRALMSREVIALREGLIGSAAAVRILLEGGEPPECLGGEAAMRYRTNYEEGHINIMDVFQHISIYVAEASWGETILRWNEVLPSVSSRFTEPVTAALKASKPDWKALWEQAEQQRAKKSEVTDEKEWRTHLQTQLDLVSDQFSELSRVASV